MKKIVRLFILLLAVIMTVSLAACGEKSSGKAKDSDKLETFIENAALYSVIDGDWEGMSDDIEIEIEFDAEDGEVTLITSTNTDKEIICDFEIKKSNLYIDHNKIEYEFKNNDLLILTIDGVKTEFERIN